MNKNNSRAPKSCALPEVIPPPRFLESLPRRNLPTPTLPRQDLKEWESASEVLEASEGKCSVKEEYHTDLSRAPFNTRRYIVRALRKPVVTAHYT